MLCLIFLASIVFCIQVLTELDPEFNKKDPKKQVERVYPNVKHTLLIVKPDVEYFLEHNITNVDLITRPWLCKATSEVKLDGTVNVIWYEKRGLKWFPEKIKRTVRTEAVTYNSIICFDVVLENGQIPSDIFNQIYVESKTFQEKYEKLCKVRLEAEKQRGNKDV